MFVFFTCEKYTYMEEVLVVSINIKLLIHKYYYFTFPK